MRDILRGDAQALAVASTIKSVAPDIILLTGVDWDYQGIAFEELNNLFYEHGHGFSHVFSFEPNSGMRTGFDLDGDGRLGRARDAQGFGYFPGSRGMVLFSNTKIVKAANYSALLWKDIPGANLPVVDQELFPSKDVYDVQRLSSVGHWDLTLTNGLRLFAFSAGSPVFDGPEDRNGLRNHDEISFWNNHLNATSDKIVILGNANLDPIDGEGRHSAIRDLLDHPMLQDAKPKSLGGAKAAEQGGANNRHQGDPSLDTVDWTDDPGPGNLRVSYVIPDSRVTVIDAGVFWPVDNAQNDATRHKLVWVELQL